MWFRLVAVILVLVLVSAVSWWFLGSGDDAEVVVAKESVGQPVQLVREQSGGLLEGEDAYEAGINPQMIDKPKMQVAWMKRGHDITLNNYPDADSANFRNSYFHRGFKNTAVTCGEVEFLSGDEVIEPFQRFIFTGLQNSFFENRVENFEIFWEKMCVQAFDG